MFSRNNFFSFLYHCFVLLILFLMFMIVFQKKSAKEEFRSPVIFENITTTPDVAGIEITPAEESTPAGTVNTEKDRIIDVGPADSIQTAVDKAQPGVTINLLPGVYFQDIVTKRSGTPDNPITFSGSKDAVLKGGGKSRIFEINHDYITLKGFTIDGQFGDAGKSTGYRDKLIYVLGKSARKGVTGLKILSMNIKNAGGECIRLRYFAQNNEIAYNNISRCGVIDFSFKGGGKNGEGVYIGTAPEQLKDGKNPTSDRDESNNNLVHHNTINTQGNECVDIKEGSSGNVVEYNNCTGQKDPESGGLDSRGNNNIFRFNEIYGNSGAGVRLGGDKSSDGIGNDVYSNTIRNNASGGIKFQRSPQGKICGNKMEGNTGGDAVGSEGEDFHPTSPCS